VKSALPEESPLNNSLKNNETASYDNKNSNYKEKSEQALADQGN
jgi:hypothetical protein